MKNILEGIRFVADNSNHVHIDINRLEEEVLKFDSDNISSWRDVAPFPIPILKDNQKIAFIMVLDSLNFCYWGNPKWTINYNGKDMDGAFGLMGCMYKALEENIPILDPKYLEHMTVDDAKHLFKGNTEIPLFDNRLKILNELGRNTNDKYHGDFSKLIMESDKDVFKFLQNIVDIYPSFNDVSRYKDKEIKFYKRAQLVASDIHDEFHGSGLGEFHNINKLTACAEYKIPQILRKLGILQYDNGLSQKVDNKIELPKDSVEEVEIRANMVWAVELMKNKLVKKYPDVTSAIIYNYLWVLSQEKSPTDKPYHLTRTIAY